MLVQFIKFVGVGGINTVVTYMIYLILLLFINYQISYAIAYLFGIILSYWLNLQFVFNEKGSKRKIITFPLVYLVQYLLGAFLLYVFVDQFRINKAFGPLIVVFLSVPITFLLTKKILTKNEKKT